MLCFAMLSVFSGLVFWNLDDGVSGMVNRINLLFMHAMFLLLMVRGLDGFLGRGAGGAGEEEQPGARGAAFWGEEKVPVAGKKPPWGRGVQRGPGLLGWISLGGGRNCLGGSISSLCVRNATLNTHAHTFFIPPPPC